MHGIIHVVFKDFLLKKFGQQVWDEVLKRAGLEDDKTILEMKQYDDGLTFTAVKLACEVLDVELTPALELFGSHFVDFAISAGFYNQLKSLGSNIVDLLTNLNLLHHNLERDFRSAVFPVFSVDLESDSGDETTFVMTYTSTRFGFGPLITGVLRRVAERLFEIDLAIEALKTPAAEAGEFPLRLCTATDDPEVVLRLRTTKRQAPAPTSQGVAEERPTEEPEKGEGGTSQPSSWMGGGWSFSDLHQLFVACCKADTQQLREQEVDADDEVIEFEVSDGDIQDLESLVAQKNEAIKLVAQQLVRKNAKSSTASAEVFAASRFKISRILFRSVPADKVGAEWTDEASIEVADSFWQEYSKLDKYYFWSSDVTEPGGSKRINRDIVLFLSHAWECPENWNEAVGDGVSYATMKATELCGMAKDLAAHRWNDYSRWRDVHFWVDKCCIPQFDGSLTKRCVHSLEDFMALSDGFVVMLTWTYFERLWCVYEWVCFLASHDPENMYLCVDAFVRTRTLPLLLDCLRNFSIKNCKCSVEADRELLHNKVDQHYISHSHFEEFLKFTAIALIAKDLAKKRSAQAARALKPWIELARSCGFELLAERLEALSKQTAAWWREVATNRGRAFGLDMQTAIIRKVNDWFVGEVHPLIHQMREMSLRSGSESSICSSTAVPSSGLMSRASSLSANSVSSG
eukprot:TRINITY_DN33143_c0_g1_i1.p1 TRINITY_DN33143_c0_g1~~TRINITY_DN33143_c0_g1_i1.p1  ORF type:complete len:688 (+),score=139.60 TRINITY_DN33143_c0_g1_i1:75-2138(+)